MRNHFFLCPGGEGSLLLVPLRYHLNLVWMLAVHLMRVHHNKNAIFTHVITNLSAWKRRGKWEGSYYSVAAITLVNKVMREFRPEDFRQHLCNASKNFCLGWAGSSLLEGHWVMQNPLFPGEFVLVVNTPDTIRDLTGPEYSEL